MFGYSYEVDVGIERSASEYLASSSRFVHFKHKYIRTHTDTPTTRQPIKLHRMGCYLMLVYVEDVVVVVYFATRGDGYWDIGYCEEGMEIALVDY